MGRDNAPKERQRQQLERKQTRRASYDRILIVSEGTKTEPLYFGEIRTAYRLHSANVQVRPSEQGTAPLRVVQYAQALFKNGDKVKMVAVETGIADNTWMEVKHGVASGDEVVSGSYAAISRTLKDGVVVRLEQPKKEPLPN